MSAPDSPVTEKPLSTANDGTEARRRLRLGEVLVTDFMPVGDGSHLVRLVENHKIIAQKNTKTN